MLVALLGVGCSSGISDPILQLSAPEALEIGKDLMAKEEYKQAQSYLVHAFEIEPNTASGREGLILMADALYLDGGEANWVKSQGRYRDFLNRFPTSPRAAYAQFQIGMSISKRLEKPDRDQSLTGDALDAFNDVRRLYPTSEYSEKAVPEMERINNHSAEHEYGVARFYQRYQRFGTSFAALNRYEGIIEDYPTFQRTDRVLFELCKLYSLSAVDEHIARGKKVCGRLQDEFAGTVYARKATKIKSKWSVMAEDLADEEQQAVDDEDGAGEVGAEEETSTDAEDTADDPAGEPADGRV